ARRACPSPRLRRPARPTRAFPGAARTRVAAGEPCPRPPRCQRSVAALAGLTALLAGALSAEASPLELLSRIALHPSDPNLIALSYEEGGQGLLYSRDGGQHFALRCGSSISSSFTNGGHPMAFGGDGRLLIGFFTGMS